MFTVVEHDQRSLCGEMIDDALGGGPSGRLTTADRCEDSRRNRVGVCRGSEVAPVHAVREARRGGNLESKAGLAHAARAHDRHHRMRADCLEHRGDLTDPAHEIIIDRRQGSHPPTTRVDHVMRLHGREVLTDQTMHGFGTADVAELDLSELTKRESGGHPVREQCSGRLRHEHSARRASRQQPSETVHGRPEQITVAFVHASRVQRNPHTDAVRHLPRMRVDCSLDLCRGPCRCGRVVERGHAPRRPYV